MLKPELPDGGPVIPRRERKAARRLLELMAGWPRRHRHRRKGRRR